MEGYIALQRIIGGEVVTATRGEYEGARIFGKDGKVYIIKAGQSTPEYSEELTSFAKDDFEIVKVVKFQEAVVSMLSGLFAERYDNGRTICFKDNQFMVCNEDDMFVPTTITPSDYEQMWRVY